MMNKKSIIIKYISLSLIIIGSGFLSAAFQDNIVGVSAEVDPIAFMAPNAEFGVVFPQEILEKNFYVVAQADPEDGSCMPLLYYSLVNQPKPLPQFIEEVGQWEARNYCVNTDPQNDPDYYQNCYYSLCPYLDGVSREEHENDTSQLAFLNGVYCENCCDQVDYWKIVLTVPPIKGYVGQDFTGQPVDMAGAYGCDIALELLDGPPYYCGDGNLDPGEECDDGNNIGGDGCSASCLLEEWPPECTDNDRDGYFIEGGDCGPVDCNDNDYYINPGMSEFCDNEIDDDCDGDVDCDDSECEADKVCQGGPIPECTSGETQACNTGELGICASGTQTCSQEGFWGSCLPDSQPGTEICDNGLDDDCDGYIDSADSDCSTNGEINGGGGGGGGPLGLIIFNEKIKEIYSDRVIISWFTSINATSRIIYDTSSGVFVFDNPPNYGYAYSTTESDTPAISNGVTYHEVEVIGLSPGIPYYFRVVSHASPEKVGQELGFTLPSEEEEEEEEEEVGQPTEETGPAEEAVSPLISPAAGPAEEEEVVIEEEPAPEEEAGPEEVTQVEEEEEAGTFLAAIAGLFTGGNFCWILTLIITALIVLYILSRKKKKLDKEIDHYRRDSIIAIIILIILTFLIKCYLLIIPIIILLIFLLLKEKFSKNQNN